MCIRDRWYSTLYDCGYAYSKNGREWTKPRNASLISRTKKSYYEDFAYCGAVKKIGEKYHAFISGKSGTSWRSGYVIFTDPEANWSPSTSLLNPKNNGITTLAVAGTNGDNTITVSDANNFEIGEYIILDDNNRKTPHFMPCIDGITGNVLHLDRVLKFNIPAGYDVKSIYSSSNFISDFWYDDLEDEWIYSFVAFQQFKKVVLEFSVFGKSKKLGAPILYDYNRGQIIEKQYDKKAWDWTSRENFKLIDCNTSNPNEVTDL